MAAQLEVFTTEKWTFRVRNDSQILSLKDIQKWENKLKINPGDNLPEAIFGNNFMEMSYKGSNGITQTLKWHALYLLRGALYRKEPDVEELYQSVQQSYIRSNNQSDYEVLLEGSLSRRVTPVIKSYGAMTMPLKRSANAQEKNSWALSVPLIGNTKLWQKNALADCTKRGITVEKLEPALDWTFTSLVAVNIVSGGTVNENLLDGTKFAGEMLEVKKISVPMTDAGTWGTNDREKPLPHMKSAYQPGSKNENNEVMVKAMPGGCLPLETLSDQNLPIKFHTSVELFRDDLNDSGHADCIAMIRVMETFWFAKLRMTMHVDQVLARVVECRLFCWHDRPEEVYVEWSLKEASLGDPKIGQKIEPLIQQGHTRVESLNLYVDKTTPQFSNFSVITMEQIKREDEPEI